MVWQLWYRVFQKGRAAAAAAAAVAVIQFALFFEEENHVCV